MLSVCIIGAGITGICSAHHLAKQPSKFTFNVYEQCNHIGGVWQYTQHNPTSLIAPMNDIDMSSMYNNLYSNLPKEISHFTDLDYKQLPTSYLHRSDILDYLIQFVEHFKLSPYIKTNTKVINVKPKQIPHRETQWEIIIQDLKSGLFHTSIYDYVMVCSGHFRKEHIFIPGYDLFPGIKFHSRYYRIPDVCKNKKVLIVGAGSSGLYISLDVLGVASEVHLSYNIAGQGNPAPGIIVHPTIKNLTNNGSAIFSNGSELHNIEILIACTGYEHHYPFLENECRINTEKRFIYPLHLDVFNAYYPTMIFIGVCQRVLPFIYTEQQVRLAIAYFNREYIVPSCEETLQMLNKELEIKSLSGVKEKHYQTFQSPQQLWSYMEVIAALSKSPPPKTYFRDLHFQVAEDRKDVTNFRKRKFIFDKHFETFVVDC